jgi:hypothetical protein
MSGLHSKGVSIMKEIIQKYLEEQCKVDPCLAEKYKDTLINGCVEYINKMAREELKSQNGYIADEVVYHWAREYYVDGIAEKEKAAKVQKQVEKMSDLSKVKVNKDISEDRKERMRQALSKAKAELHQQEFDF